jgi:curli production assembly/transport component CsgE
MNTRLLVSVLLVMGIQIPFSVNAQKANVENGALPETRIEEAERNSTLRDRLADPLGGAVINRTVTVLGHDFYRYFTIWWRQKDISSHVSITIYERPTARFGSEVWVQYRQQKMFRIFLPPARAATKSISAQAVEIVYQNIATSEVERAMTRSPDLAPEEL